MDMLLLAALLLSLLANGWLIWRVWRPLQRLSEGAVRLADGDMGALERPCGGAPQVEALRRAMLAMSGHVQRAQEGARAYAGALVRGQESERQRLAHELHDDTVQALIALGQSLDLARSALKTQPERVDELLTTARASAAETVVALRDRIADLRPPALDELGLAAALRMLAEPAADGLTVQIEGAERRLEPILELALFRTAQEALHNARRHAAAMHIHITLSYYPDQVRLAVRDDGRGFRPPDDLGRLAAGGHYGLLGIQERLAAFGGTLRLESAPGAGSLLEARVAQARGDQPVGAVQDPVCSALIQPDQAYGSAVYAGQTYYFCCPVCRGAFQRDPQAYVGRDAAGAVG